MRKTGWQLPYHPLQVVAISVFLALGCAFYVFFLPFVGNKLFEYVVLGLYTPLVSSVFFLYIWCAATDPSDPGVLKSRKHCSIEDDGYQNHPKVSRLSVESDSTITEAQPATTADVNPQDEGTVVDVNEGRLPNKLEVKKNSCWQLPLLVVLFGWCPLPCICRNHQLHGQSSQQPPCEDSMFYCILCKVEVAKHSKHCRICDKCVDGFDHHCRWLNNCIGKRNYRRFFILMGSALLMLILQWVVGVLVLILCFLRQRRYSEEIIAKLGSSFSFVPFLVVVASCTLLAMVATVRLAQLFFFHILLIRKGISTYDYIVALREQDQQTAGSGQQSPQMSSVSSLTGMSSASSMNTFHRASWCTPPRMFLEDELDVLPPETGTSTSSVCKKMIAEESAKKSRMPTVKLSPWTLAQLNAEEVSKVAAQARKKSKILQPVQRREMHSGQKIDSSLGSGSSRMPPRPDNWRRTNKRGRHLVGLPLEPLSNVSASASNSTDSELAAESSTTLAAPLQQAARSAFSRMSFAGIVSSSPASSLDSSDLHRFRVSFSTGEEVPELASAAQNGTPLSRSTSGGYDASGGEDSDRVSSRIVHRPSNWASLVLKSGHGGFVASKTWK